MSASLPSQEEKEGDKFDFSVLQEKLKSTEEVCAKYDDLQREKETLQVAYQGLVEKFALLTEECKKHEEVLIILMGRSASLMAAKANLEKEYDGALAMNGALRTEIQTGLNHVVQLNELARNKKIGLAETKRLRRKELLFWRKKRDEARYRKELRQLEIERRNLRRRLERYARVLSTVDDTFNLEDMTLKQLKALGYFLSFGEAKH